MEYEKYERTVIAALPGWYVALYVESYGDNDHVLSLEPVIAWEIERFERPFQRMRAGEPCVSHAVLPIMLDGSVDDQSNQWALKRPDGLFDIPHDRSGCSEDEVLAAFKRIHALERERKDKADAVQAG